MMNAYCTKLLVLKNVKKTSEKSVRNTIYMQKITEMEFTISVNKSNIHTVFIKQKLLNTDIKDALFIMPGNYLILNYNDFFK